MQSSICWLRFNWILSILQSWMILCRMTRYIIHKQRPSTGPLQQAYFLPSHFYTLFSLMFIFHNIHCYHNLFILLVLVRHTPFLHRCKLSWTQNVVVSFKPQQKDSLKCNHRTHNTAVDSGDLSVAISMFKVLSAGAYSQQRSKVRVWGDKEMWSDNNYFTNFRFLLLVQNVLIHQLSVRGNTK